VELHRRPKPGDKWHCDEGLLMLNGERHYLWRAVDQDGNVLDILVQRRRNKAAAQKFFCTLLMGLNIHDAIIGATALVSRDILHESVAVVTKNGAMTRSGLLETVW
jgi:putative transposase